jgi:hypothetical protein
MQRLAALRISCKQFRRRLPALQPRMQPQEKTTFATLPIADDFDGHNVLVRRQRFRQCEPGRQRAVVIVKISVNCDHRSAAHQRHRCIAQSLLLRIAERLNHLAQHLGLPFARHLGLDLDRCFDLVCGQAMLPHVADKLGKLLFGQHVEQSLDVRARDVAPLVEPGDQRRLCITAMVPVSAARTAQ